MSQITSQDIMLATAIVFGLATACQIIAPRLKIPALVLLLPAGFLFGVIAPQFRFDQILGTAFPVAVNLMVAIILFQGGMELSTIPLDAKDKTVVRKLIWIGAPITLVTGALASYFLLDLRWEIALVLGAFVIVSGPTVVTPILNVVRPNTRVRGVLMWEGTLLDPIGALVAVVIFQIIKATSASSPIEAIELFLFGAITAIAAAFVGVVLIVAGGKLVKGNEMLETQVLLGSVLVAAGLANAVNDDSGLLTALLMGFAAPRLAAKFGASLPSAKPFFNTIVSIGIGVLFISIAALVSLSTVTSMLWLTLGVALVLMLIVRPLVVAIGTAKTTFSRNERIFMSWMYPRGIVAAATASSIGTSLFALKIPGAEKLLPAAFIIIAVTVTVYGLSATPLARMLNIQADSSADQAQNH